MKTHDEAAFETTIAEHLVAHGGYSFGQSSDYDAERALMTADLFGFIEATQPKAWTRLQGLHKASLHPLFLNAYAKAVAQRGVLDVLRHGLKFYGTRIKVAAFAPAHGLNPQVQLQYAANRLVVVRQLHYDPTAPDLSLDLALFVNGIPVVTAELKNAMTGQTVVHAKKQYRTDRSPDAPIFRFKRGALVHFAVDTDVAEVRATAGNNHLGGNDIDNRLVDWLASEFKKANGLDISGDRMVRQRLLEAAEKAKMDLSTSMETEIHLPFLTADESGPKHLQTVLTRATFEFLVEDLLKKCIDECEKALTESKLDSTEIHEVIMVGGSSRIPKIQEMVKQLFVGCPLNKSFNPDEVVAVGAAVQAGMLGGSVKDVTLLDVTNFSLGIEIEGRRSAKLIPKGSTVPVVRTQMVSTVVDNQKTTKIHVLQGEEELAKDNISLGEFELTNIQPAPRGVPRIEVTFTIDTDGIVNVSARDVRTGAQQGITIHSPSGMSQQAIDAARQELEQAEEAEEVGKELQDLRHKVEKQLFGLENFLRDSKLSLKKREIFDTEQALKRGRMALVKKADADALRELSQYLVNYQAHLKQRVDSADGGSVSVGLAPD